MLTRLLPGSCSALCILLPCTAVNCGRPDVDYNGVVYGNDWWVGSVVRYACRPGFMLLGSPTRSCQSDGLWTPKPACLSEYTPSARPRNRSSTPWPAFSLFQTVRDVLAGEDWGEWEGAQRHMQLHMRQQELLRPTKAWLHPHRQLPEEGDGLEALLCALRPLHLWLRYIMSWVAPTQSRQVQANALFELMSCHLWCPCKEESPVFLFIAPDV